MHHHLLTFFKWPTFCPIGIDDEKDAGSRRRRDRRKRSGEEQQDDEEDAEKRRRREKWGRGEGEEDEKKMEEDETEEEKGRKREKWERGEDDTDAPKPIRNLAELSRQEMTPEERAKWDSMSLRERRKLKGGGGIIDEDDKPIEIPDEGGKRAERRERKRVKVFSVI